MSGKPAPRFGGGGEKCKTCDKTVYPNERISYDNGTWHQLCFKCMSCRSTLSLTAVAMINGDLYCKTCFKKIFMREGKYSSFDTQKSLTKDMAAELTQAASMSGVVEGGSGKPSPTVSRSASIVGMGMGGGNTAASVSVPSTGTAAPQTPVERLQSAVEKKDMTQCQTLLATHGAALLFERVKSGATVLEWSLTSYMYKSMGVKLMEWLENKMDETNRLLRENGLNSPLEGSEGEQQQQSGDRQQVEESKESTETATEGTEAEAEPATEVEVTA